MSSERELHNWVSDKLHENMGLSDRHAVDYLINLAKKTDNVQKYVANLSDVLGDGHNFENAAMEIWHKIPRKEKVQHINRIKEQIAIEEQNRNASYKMLSDSEDEVPVIKPIKHKDKKKKKKQKSDKDRESNIESSGDERKKKKYKSSKKDNDEDNRLQDLKERDEFSERLKRKDKERTRNLVEKSDKKAFEEAKKRLKLEEEDRKKIIPELRDRARKEYVKKRKVEKLDSLREDIEDDEKMFHQNELTEREKLERQYKKKVTNLL